MENWDRFVHYNNKLERVSQSTTMRNSRQVSKPGVSDDFKNSRHRETTIIPRKIKIKITILNTFRCVTESLPLTISEQDDESLLAG